MKKDVLPNDAAVELLSTPYLRTSIQVAATYKSVSLSHSQNSTESALSWYSRAHGMWSCFKLKGNDVCFHEFNLMNRCSRLIGEIV